MVFVYGKRVHEFFARGVGFRNIGFEINARLSFFVRYVFYGFREFFARFFDIFRSVPAIVVLVENNRFIKEESPPRLHPLNAGAARASAIHTEIIFVCFFIFVYS